MNSLKSYIGFAVFTFSITSIPIVGSFLEMGNLFDELLLFGFVGIITLNFIFNFVFWLGSYKIEKRKEGKEA